VIGRRAITMIEISSRMSSTLIIIFSRAQGEMVSYQGREPNGGNKRREQGIDSHLNLICHRCAEKSMLLTRCMVSGHCWTSLTPPHDDKLYATATSSSSKLLSLNTHDVALSHLTAYHRYCHCCGGK
jgi:hypothetical protein